MFDWIFKKERPDFWQEYSSHFKTKGQKELSTVRFVVFDTETTGLNVSEDRILSIGAIGLIDGVIDVADSFEVYLDQKLFKSETVNIHGILKGGKIEKVSEELAATLFLNYIKDAVIVAHHAAFDIAMINAGLVRMGLPKLRNKVLDTGMLFKKTDFCQNKKIVYSLDYLCDLFNLKMHDRHTASGDAYLTGLIFIKIVSALKKSSSFQYEDLFFDSDKRGLL